MNYLFLFPSIVLFIMGILRTINLLRGLWKIKMIQKKYQLKLISITSKIFILLPAHFEQSLVKETLDYFSKIDYLRELLTIIVITSDAEKEIRETNQMKLDLFCQNLWKRRNNILDFSILRFNSGLFPHNLLNKVSFFLKDSNNVEDFKANVYNLYKIHLTTNELVKEWIKNSPNDNIILLNDPNTASTKSSKLNYALQYIEQKYIIDESTYIGIYDFDSRPDSRTLKYLNDSIKNDNSIFVFQQISIPIIKLIGHTKTNRIERMIVDVYSLMHIRRALGVEAIMHLDSIFNSLILKYCVGSGMFINAKKLIQLNGFAITADDIPLGYRASFLNLKTRIIPFFNCVGINVTLGSLFGQVQNIFWAISAGLIEEYELLKRSGDSIHKPFVYTRMICTIINHYAVLPVMSLFLVSVIYFTLTAQLTYLKLALISFYISYGLSAIAISSFLNNLKSNKTLFQNLESLNKININFFILLILSPLRGVLRALLIFNSLVKNIVNYNKGEKKLMIKSER